MVWKEKSSESRVASSLYILSKDNSPFTPFIFSGLLLFLGFSLGELRDFLWVSVKILIVVIWQIDCQTQKQLNVLMWIWKSPEDGQYLHLCKGSLSTQVYSLKKKVDFQIYSWNFMFWIWHVMKSVHEVHYEFMTWGCETILTVEIPPF